MDERDRTRIEIRLVLAVWRRELRRLADASMPDGDRVALEEELRGRALEVLTIARERIHAAGDAQEDLDELSRAHEEIGQPATR